MLAIVAIASLALLAVGVAMTLESAPPSPEQNPSLAPPTVSAAASVTASASPSPPAVPVPVPEDMVKIPAGTFTMGNDKAGPGDRPAHTVTLKAFLVDKTEVTAGAYAACVTSGACTARNVHSKKGSSASVYGCNTEQERGNHPANCVDREQAEAYCAFANKRLPTEAEWEYAARGPEDREYPWGNGAPTSCAQATVSGIGGECGQRKGTLPVGSASEGASAFGVLDMAGNVFEWVADGYSPYTADPATDPSVPLGNKKGIIRGGSWDYSAVATKATLRTSWVADAGNASIGFRCARSE
jgi:formylglycine-generating enzyme required for sulfatase activity